MQRVLLIYSYIILTLCSAGSLSAFEKDKWYACEVDDDCTSVQSVCGTQASVNIKFKSDWESWAKTHHSTRGLRCPNAPKIDEKEARRRQRRGRNETEFPVSCRYNRCMPKRSFQAKPFEQTFINEFETAQYNIPGAERVGYYFRTYRYKEARLSKEEEDKLNREKELRLKKLREKKKSSFLGLGIF